MYQGLEPARLQVEKPVPWRALTVVAITCVAMGVCLALLFFGMRGVMELGGFVAQGGPYEIAHPAPDWVWVVPVSIVGGFLVGGINLVAAHRAGGYTLVLPVWCVLFLSLGWNFLEYGVRPPGGDGLAWGWLVCAALFVVMGLAPLLLPFIGLNDYLRRKRALTRGFDPASAAVGARPSGGRSSEAESRRRFLTGYTILVVVSAGVGALLGTLAFRALAG